MNSTGSTTISAFAPVPGGWFTMGMLLTIPMLLVGFTLMFMAYRRREPSGNYSAVAQPA